MNKIIPSILTNDPNEAKELISRCEGVVDRVSVDVVDGKFADNKTIDPNLLSDVDTQLKIDYQLMVVEPINWVEGCVRGQADRIIGHIERMKDQAEFVGKVQEVGASVGLGLDLGTPVESIDSSIIINLDVVLIMSVRAGFGGQMFNESVVAKIKKLNQIRKHDETPFKIHVDGGITLDNINKVIQAGADEVLIGRRLFDGDLTENLRKFQEAVHNVGTGH